MAQGYVPYSSITDNLYMATASIHYAGNILVLIKQNFHLEFRK
jgi:hypothetical protein